MKTTKILAILVLALGLMVWSVEVSEAAPMGTAFTYQGRLMDSNQPADGLYDFQFKLYDSNDPCTGTQLASPIDINDFDVIEGYFVVELDFGSDVFDGNAVWLEIGVRPGEMNDPNVYTLLSPRQEVTPVPYALHTRGVFVGADNTFVGLDAGLSNTTGNYNTFLGQSAGYSNTTGRRNTFSGSGAGYSNTTGNYNTLLGDQAGWNNNTGYSNTFFGYRAGHRNTTGYYNTFLGEAAGYSNTESYGNTFVGYRAGRDNTTGFGNTFLGIGAGAWNTTGSRNVFIGYDAGLRETGSNKLYIANSDVDPPLIYGDFSTGNVGIGTALSVGRRTGEPSIAARSDAAGGWLIMDSNGPGSVGLNYYTDANVILAYGGGNVGIGTTSPAAKLTVNGAILRDGSTMYGTRADTHINLGTNSTTGESGYNRPHATVGGGYSNTASDYYATVGGGYKNTASEYASTIGGGYKNTASGDVATVGGGYENSVSGLYATVPGGFWNDATGSYSFAAGRQAKANHNGAFVWADSTGADFASTARYQFLIRASGGVGIGTNSPGAQLDVMGRIRISNTAGDPVLEMGEGLDYAEGFDVSDKSDIAGGTVLIIDSKNPGRLAISDKPYDSRVAGIVAGAKGQGSGVRLGSDEFDYDVALAGRVYCNVDATEAAVEPGDLLTTSATPGYAMKATDYIRTQGAILGKAMEKLEKGKKGQILVLVTLQ